VDCCAKRSWLYNLILLVPNVCSVISIFVLFGDRHINYTVISLLWSDFGMFKYHVCVSSIFCQVINSMQYFVILMYLYMLFIGIRRFSFSVHPFTLNATVLFPVSDRNLMENTQRYYDIYCELLPLFIIVITAVCCVQVLKYSFKVQFESSPLL
jgi:hypothetical protein